MKWAGSETTDNENSMRWQTELWLQAQQRDNIRYSAAPSSVSYTRQDALNCVWLLDAFWFVSGMQVNAVWTCILEKLRPIAWEWNKWRNWTQRHCVWCLHGYSWAFILFFIHCRLRKFGSIYRDCSLLDWDDITLFMNMNSCSTISRQNSKDYFQRHCELPLRLKKIEYIIIDLFAHFFVQIQTKFTLSLSFAAGSMCFHFSSFSLSFCSRCKFYLHL